MKISKTLLLIPLLSATGCPSNSAPGNDRASDVDAAPTAAPVSTVAEAVGGVEAGLLLPEILTEADLAAIPAEPCTFRMTTVGYPIFRYADAGSGTLKLNGHLITLPASGGGEFASEGVRVELHPVEDRVQDERFDADFILHVPGAPDERGYRGYAQCNG